MPTGGAPREIVSVEGIQLMEQAPHFTYLSGIVELESNTDTLLNPEREKKLLESLKEMKAGLSNKESLATLEAKTMEIFFSSLNQSQAQIISSKMTQWENDVKGLNEEELLKYREKKLDECLKILEQRTGPVKQVK
jgi:chorismate mutase